MPSDSELHLQRRSAAELVADTIQTLIINGQLGAGERLRESQLSKDLQISRNSLREGIRLLEQSRLVTYEMHRGAIVSEPTLTDLTDLYNTRRHLEMAAAQVEATDEQLQQVRDAFIRLESSAGTTEAGPIVDADLSLHQAIVDLLGSERLSAFFMQVRRELTFYFTMLSHADGEYIEPQEPIVNAHAAIVDALCERRTADATRLIDQHIDENYARLRAILAERTAAGAAARDSD